MPETQTKRKSASPARPASAPDEVAAAYARTEKDLESVAKDRVGQVTADIPTAVSLALGAIPHLESLMAEMKDMLKKPPTAQLARLRDRALATLYTHLHFVPKSRAMDEELEEARVLREQLLASADAHVAHGQLDADAVAAVREGAGHLDRANDLIALSALFQSVWDRIAAKTQISEAQLERATVLGTVLVAQLGARALGVAPKGQSWSDRRNRAFRLFIDDYEEIRRAVDYVRYHEDDAAAYAPTLHQRKRAVEEKPVAPPVLPTGPGVS